MLHRCWRILSRRYTRSPRRRSHPEYVGRGGVHRVLPGRDHVLLLRRRALPPLLRRVSTRRRGGAGRARPISIVRRGVLVIRVRARAVPALRVSVPLAPGTVHGSHARRVVELLWRATLGHAHAVGRRVRARAEPAGRLHLIRVLLARIALRRLTWMVLLLARVRLHLGVVLGVHGTHRHGGASAGDYIRGSIHGRTEGYCTATALNGL